MKTYAKASAQNIAYLRARIEAGESQESVALALGAAQSTVGRWMRRFNIVSMTPGQRAMAQKVNWFNPPVIPGDTCLPPERYTTRGLSWTAEDDATIVMAARQQIPIGEVAELLGKGTTERISSRAVDLRRRGLNVPNFPTFMPDKLHHETMPGPLMSDEKIAERYRKAGIRYEDSDKAKPDLRRFVSHREVAVSLGGAAAMCADVANARAGLLTIGGVHRG